VTEPLRLLVQKIPKLPTLPHIAREMLDRMSDDMVSVRRLEEVIENDPAMSAKILSVSNSAFFGLETPNTSVSGAIMRIGFNNVRNIALGVALMTVLDRERHEQPLDGRRIFRHSVAVAMVSKLLSDDLKFGNRDEVFVYGMLHDLGFLVMNNFFPDHYRRVMDEFAGETSLIEAEKKVLACSHADVGAWLAYQWNLPGAVSAAIRYHHAPALAHDEARKLTALVHVADWITSRSPFNVTEKGPSYPLEPSSLTLLGIGKKDLADIERGIDRNIFSRGLFDL